MARIAIAAILLLIFDLSPAWQPWTLENGRLMPAASAFVVSPSIGYNFDTQLDGPCVQLDQGVLRVSKAPCRDAMEPNWKSPADWQVASALRGDLNRNGVQELTLLVWRPFKAWPVDQFMPHGGRIATHQNRQGLSCHILLLEQQPDHSFKIVWGGSALYRPLTSIAVIDLDGDGRQELAAIESAYDARSSAGGDLTLWEWNGFGFTLVDRQKGAYTQLKTGKQENGLAVLLTR